MTFHLKYNLTLLLIPLLCSASQRLKGDSGFNCGIQEAVYDPPNPNDCTGGSVGGISDALHSGTNESAQLPLTHAGHPRVFPICVTPNNSIFDQTNPPEWVGPVQALIESLYKDFRHPTEGLRYYEFNPSLDLIDPANNDQWITSVTLSRINTIEPDMVNMRQWFHVTVNINLALFPSGIAGILVDHIVGPLGLPSGEINADFNCHDSRRHEQMKDAAHIIECDYKPAHSLKHPQLYTEFEMTGTGWGMYIHKKFNFHFKYTDVSCMETKYLQFIIAAVSVFGQQMVRGDHYKLYLSPVFTIDPVQGFDSKDGLPYPYYDLWSKDKSMWCDLKSDTELGTKLPYRSTKPEADKTYAPLPWIPRPDLLRILPNYDYEYCLLGESDTRNEIRKECPPGPFHCDMSLRSMSDSDLAAHREQWFALEADNEHCIDTCTLPPQPPATTSTPPFTYIIDSHTWDTLGDKRAHGLLCSLVYFVLFPIANLLARFFKDIRSKICIGLQHWSVGHIVIHLTAIAVLWAAIGLVTFATNDDALYPECGDFGSRNSTQEEIEACAKKQIVVDAHFTISALTFIFHHVHFVSGCRWCPTHQGRLAESTFHSLGGHLTYFAAVISAFTQNTICSSDVVIPITLQVTIYLTAFAALTVVQIMHDSEIGVRPGRNHIPVLEQILIRHPIRKYIYAKYIITGAASFLLAFMWMLALISGVVLDHRISTYVNADPSSGVATPRSIFGMCAGLPDHPNQ